MPSGGTSWQGRAAVAVEAVVDKEQLHLWMAGPGPWREGGRRPRSPPGRALFWGPLALGAALRLCAHTVSQGHWTGRRRGGVSLLGRPVAPCSRHEIATWQALFRWPPSATCTRPLPVWDLLASAHRTGTRRGRWVRHLPGLILALGPHPAAVGWPGAHDANAEWNTRGRPLSRRERRARTRSHWPCRHRLASRGVSVISSLLDWAWLSPVLPPGQQTMAPQKTGRAGELRLHACNSRHVTSRCCVRCAGWPLSGASQSSDPCRTTETCSSARRLWPLRPGCQADAPSFLAVSLATVASGPSRNESLGARLQAVWRSLPHKICGCRD